MDRPLVIEALRATGERLALTHREMPRVRVYVIGGIAGMLSGEFDASRTTGDCDVIATEPGEQWDAIVQVADEVARSLRLRPGWLNGNCRMFAWQMALGWRARCHRFGDFGSLRVMMLARSDLITSKVMGAPKRVQDREDLRSLRPSAAELEAVQAHLDRIEQESGPGECDAQRGIVAWLKDQAG